MEDVGVFNNFVFFLYEEGLYWELFEFFDCVVVLNEEIWDCEFVVVVCKNQVENWIVFGECCCVVELMEQVYVFFVEYDL